MEVGTVLWRKVVSPETLWFSFTCVRILDVWCRVISLPRCNFANKLSTPVCTSRSLMSSVLMPLTQSAQCRFVINNRAPYLLGGCLSHSQQQSLVITSLLMSPWHRDTTRCTSLIIYSPPMFYLLYAQCCRFLFSCVFWPSSTVKCLCLPLF